MKTTANRSDVLANSIKRHQMKRESRRSLNFVPFAIRQVRFLSTDGLRANRFDTGDVLQ